MPSLKALSARSRARAYATTEAAAITGLPLTTVNHYIARELSPLGIAVWGDGKRTISYHGLVALRMAFEYPRSLAASSRVEVIEKALESPRKKHLTLEGGRVVVRIDTARRAVAAGLRKLHRAESIVSVDPETLRGEPCFRGTRSPVYTVAGLANAEGPNEAQRAFSMLTRSQIALACFYAKAHPRRGRPRRIGDALARIAPRRSKTISVVVD